MVILEALHNHAQHIPAKVALIEGSREVTYAALWDNIVRAANYFSGIAERGSKVMLSADKSVDFVFAYFGAHLGGMTTIPVDPSVNELRLQRILDSATPVGIWGKLHAGSAGREVKPFPVLDNADALTHDYVMPSEYDVADILFTTGTTGLPKGVMLTQRNELASAVNINHFIGNTSNDIELLALPISHSFGLGRLRCMLLQGATIDLLGSFASMRKFFREMDDRAITGFGMVPASWSYIHKMSGERLGNYAAQLKYIEIGSAPMSMADKHLLMELLPRTRICMHYGLTEASRSAFICFGESMDHLDSIGRPTPGVEIKIFAEDGSEVACGSEGELCVKGDNVCSAYWGDAAEEYAASFFCGYFRTGDWGYQDSEGYFHLISRKKELINVGGKKLSPLEVEEVIDAMEGVSESACVGVKDDVMGEVVKAFVVRTSESVTSDDVIATVRSKLEGYKVPASVKFVDNLPKTASGKLQRLLLK